MYCIVIKQRQFVIDIDAQRLEKFMEKIKLKDKFTFEQRF